MNGFHDFYGDEGMERESYTDSGDRHVLKEVITLVRSAVNILELVYNYYNKKKKE